MIINNKDLTPEERKDLRKEVDLKRSTMPELGKSEHLKLLIKIIRARENKGKE